MDPEIKELLRENLKLNKENNELLKKIRKFQKWGQTSKAIYWFIILAFGFGSWYFIQPYLESVMGMYGSVTGASTNVSNLTNLGNLSDVKNIQSILDQIR